MAIHKVMDQSGHSEYAFDKADKVAVKEAERRFNELTKARGFMAVQPSGDGTPGKLLKAFDADADVTFQPQLQGG